MFRLFTKHRDIAEHYNAEDIDPDSILKVISILLLIPHCVQMVHKTLAFASFFCLRGLRNRWT